MPRISSPTRPSRGGPPRWQGARTTLPTSAAEGGPGACMPASAPEAAQTRRTPQICAISSCDSFVAPPPPPPLLLLLLLPSALQRRRLARAHPRRRPGAASRCWLPPRSGSGIATRRPEGASSVSSHCVYMRARCCFCAAPAKAHLDLGSRVVSVPRSIYCAYLLAWLFSVAGAFWCSTPLRQGVRRGHRLVAVVCSTGLEAPLERLTA
mmetsp:Transcript_101270/g.286756  ORF Transcript_101270/g.286756 Transcript_101270/m.286756 type:complete len:209 (+) Transcript_101270:1232-1858(+)